MRSRRTPPTSSASWLGKNGSTFLRSASAGGVTPCLRKSARWPRSSADDERRQNGHVERVEAGQREAAVLGAALRELLHRFADDRDRARDVGGDARGPIALLVPRQKVTGEARSRG